MSIWAVCLERDTYGSWESAGEQSPNLIRPLWGVLSFLINFIVFYFICVFLRLFYVMNFYSVYFFVIGLLNNCFGYEKLFWVWKIALSSLFDYFSNALSHFLYMGNYKWDIIQLNVILIVVLKKSRCFFIFFRYEWKWYIMMDWRNEIYGWVYSRCGC